MPENLDQLVRQTQTRAMQVRAFDAATREFTGIAVPWDEVTSIAGLWDEKFERGSIEDSDDAKVFYGHTEPIGRAVRAEDADAGWLFTGRISETTRGNDVYQLLADGALDSLSIRFDPIEYRVDENDVVVITRAKVREVSVVPFPAYAGAKVSEVRSAADVPNDHRKQGDTMDPLTRADVESLLDSKLGTERSENKREFDALAARIGDAAGPTGPQFRSLGHFLKALVSGDESAADFHREYTGGGLQDAIKRNTWLDDAIKLVEKRRKVLGTFHSETLPAEGMTLEYAKLKSDTTKVQKQAEEGAKLPFGKIQLDTATTGVDTYGGYTEFSRQVIERAPVSYLNTAFRAMGIKYATATEQAARDTLNAAIATQTEAGATLALDWATAGTYDVLDLLVDAVEAFEDNGFNLVGNYVAKDVFKRLVRLEDSNGNSLMRVFGEGVNQVGSIDISGLTGRVANVEFKLLPGAAAGTSAFYDDEAITTWESSGAPYQLQDENIINLTKQFSVYGYLASAAQYPAAVVPVVPAATQA